MKPSFLKFYSSKTNSFILHHFIQSFSGLGACIKEKIRIIVNCTVACRSMSTIRTGWQVLTLRNFAHLFATLVANAQDSMSWIELRRMPLHMCLIQRIRLLPPLVRCCRQEKSHAKYTKCAFLENWGFSVFQLLFLSYFQ